MKIAITFTGLLLAHFAITIFNANVIAIFWYWYIEPITDYRAPAIATIMGILIFFDFLIAMKKKPEKALANEYGARVAHNLIAGWIALMLGALTKLIETLL